jgi:hypothetical protein
MNGEGCVDEKRVRKAIKIRKRPQKPLPVV